MCFRRIAALFDPKPWWLAGGIPASACVAAYQPKGASGLTESYTNLANPGLYNCTAPTAAPTWDVVNGWKFNGTTQYLDSGVIPPINQTWSGIVKFTNANLLSTFCSIFGAGPLVNTGYMIAVSNSVRFYYNGGYKSFSGGKSAAVMAFAGVYCYLDGAKETGTIPYTAAVNTYSVFIGSLNNAGTPYFTYSQASYIQAVAFFSTVLTDYQVAELTRAMNAL